VTAHWPVLDAHYAAYEAGDVDAIAATLAADFACGPLNGAPWVTGVEAARAMYARNVVEHPLSLTIDLGHMSLGARALRHERSGSTTGKPEVEMLAIYTLDGGLIARLDLARGGPGGEAAATVAQAQLDAYNAQALDAHVACFADDLIIANFNETPNLHGRAAYRERMGGVFAQFPENRVELLGRIVCGATVVDHERVLRSPDAEPFEVLAVYTLRDGLIARVDFVR
jgi:hypothetical protein